MQRERKKKPNSDHFVNNICFYVWKHWTDCDFYTNEVWNEIVDEQRKKIAIHHEINTIHNTRTYNAGKQWTARYKKFYITIIECAIIQCKKLLRKMKIKWKHISVVVFFIQRPKDSLSQKKNEEEKEIEKKIWKMKTKRRKKENWKSNYTKHNVNLKRIT